MPATDYLLFTLAAPMASFGAVAVGERRPTWDRPSKSQTLGLVAGALGIARAEEARHLALAAALYFAVRIDHPGVIAADYHTTQVPPQRRNRRFATRSEELAVDRTELRTILSRREFRVGSLYTIALWHGTAGDPPLAAIADALTAPAFVPFAGRKSHPLMLPMSPRIVTADGIAAAFGAHDALQPAAQAELRAAIRLGPAPGHRPIFADLAATPRQLVDRIEERRDVPESRAKWRFGLRSEALLKSKTKGGSA